DYKPRRPQRKWKVECPARASITKPTRWPERFVAHQGFSTTPALERMQRRHSCRSYFMGTRCRGADRTSGSVSSCGRCQGCRGFAILQGAKAVGHLQRPETDSLFH